DATDNGVTLSAPLAPNINHRETVFGGSASAVAILAAWTLLHVRLTNADIRSRVVIQRNTMNYDLPITGTFSATARLPEDAQWENFLKMLMRKGRARITISVTLHCGQETVGRLTGEFVALGNLAQ
ncbi:MAG: thioesterase domain-containing protein, partial [Gammaproteobacteria bacterium]|nr:thioesterase domain-containing protein [Gammaproteobacteria bacterium]